MWVSEPFLFFLNHSIWTTILVSLLSGQLINHFGSDWNIWPTIGWFAVRFCADIHGPRTIKPCGDGNPLTFPGMSSFHCFIFSMSLRFWPCFCWRLENKSLYMYHKPTTISYPHNTHGGITICVGHEDSERLREERITSKWLIGCYEVYFE